ncbi:hypothetical protein Pcinc_010541 [Petrolisthes cinctipes]|uniref:Uncharacterized protein n=1 Tax=Petrolisthes cinctipes TaxID=88211 RepID=A0AAE1G557_PETCI|nr:hypothetical protein Pcinc_010541 [Petrolisthes cinctipes]
MPTQYTQSFRVSWLSVDELKGWLQPVEGDKTKAYCCYCKTDLNAKLCDLRKHATTQRHRKCANIVTDSRQQKIQETQRVLKAFHGDNIDPIKLLCDLTELIESLSRKILLPTARVNPLTGDMSSFVDRRAYLSYELPRSVTRKIGTMQAYSDSYKEGTSSSSASRNEDADDVLSFL